MNSAMNDLKKAVSFIIAVLLIACTSCGKNDKKDKTESDVGSSISTSVSTAETSGTSTVCTTSSAVTTASAKPREQGINDIAEAAHSDGDYPSLNIAELKDAPNYRSAAVLSVDDEKMLFSDDIHTHTAPASLTKLLTAATVLKYVDTDEIFTVGSEQALVSPYSSMAYIQPGQQISVYDLMTGMLMASGNDAAYSLAVCTARQKFPEEDLSDQEAADRFCELMNETAEEIGMKESHFVTPDGWDDPDHYTTVNDLLVLAEYVLKVPEIKEITGTFTKTVNVASGDEFTWTNSNYLLDPSSPYYCEYAVGMKTGTTLSAGNCLIAAIEKNSKTYITAVTGCDTDDSRYVLTLKLIDTFI